MTYEDMTGAKLTYNGELDLTGESGKTLPASGFSQGAGFFWSVPNSAGLEEGDAAELVAVVHDGSYTRPVTVDGDAPARGSWRFEWELLYDRDSVVEDRDVTRLRQNVAATGDATAGDFERDSGFEELDPDGPLRTLDFGTMPGTVGGDGSHRGSVTHDLRREFGRGPLLGVEDSGRYSFSIRWDGCRGVRIDVASHYRLYFDVVDAP